MSGTFMASARLAWLRGLPGAFIAIVLATSCHGSLFRTPREVALQKAHANGADTLCANAVVASCVQMTSAECRVEARPYVESCIKELLPELPENADRDQAREWSKNLGRCLPRAFLRSLGAQGKVLKTCPYR